MDRIKRSISFALIFISSFFLISTYAAESDFQSPIGFWKTIDDATGKPKSIVQIWETKDKVLMGKVIKIYPKAGDDQTKLCTACTGDKRNQPIVGMVIMSGLKLNDNQWNSGEILDPENGKTYSCAVNLASSGKQLNVRGYVGLPLLGRSQTWKRVDLLADSDKYEG